MNSKMIWVFTVGATAVGAARPTSKVSYRDCCFWEKH
jgi:hypothetical protein